MKRLVRLIAGIAMVLAIPLGVASCAPKADVISENISRAADQFEVYRRIAFYNGITDTQILVIEGLCSLGNYDSEGRLSVTCMDGPDSYKKHFLGLSDNVTFFGSVSSKR